MTRARSARIALEAPADRPSAGWYENGMLRPLRSVRTGAETWNVTLPATSGRLVLNVIFEIKITTVPYDLRIDRKRPIRRTALAKVGDTGPNRPHGVPWGAGASVFGR